MGRICVECGKWTDSNSTGKHHRGLIEVSYIAVHTEINEDERQAQSIISNILALHVQENETRGISLAQFELRSVRSRET